MKLSNGAPVMPRQLAHQMSWSCSALSFRDDRATDHVAVAVEVLRGRVEHEIRAELQRLLPGRREERVVDHDERARGLAECRDLLDIRDAQERVARRLDPQQRGRLRQRFANRSFVVEGDEVDFALAALMPRVEERVRNRRGRSREARRCASRWEMR